MPDLKVEQPKSLVAIVEERLRDAIVDAEMRLGETLSEEALSEALGVSRTPVREALARLQLQGLVTIVPKKGTFVFAPTEEDVSELCVFRYMLETQALRECMSKAREAALAAMKGALAAMEAAQAGGSRRDYARADTVFHEVFFQHCGNRYLGNAYRGVSGRVAALRTHLSVPLEGEQERSMAEHHLMVEAFAAGRLADLDSILHRHIMRAWDAYADVLRSGGMQGGAASRSALHRQRSNHLAYSVLEPMLSGESRERPSKLGRSRMTIALKAAALALALAATPALAQDKVKLITIAELSGPGATAGTNWKSGIELAVEEINAKGGILGRKIDLVAYDTQTNPANARAAVQRAIDEGTHAVLGPVYTGSIMASMQIAQRAEIAQLAAGDGTAYTAQGNPFIFRTSLSQSAAMPKIAAYLKDQVKAKSVAVVWVNNDFGKGGHEAILKELKSRGIEVPVDLSTEQGQADFAGEAIKVKNAAVDAVFVYLNEEESARLLVAMRDQNVGKPVIGETTILSQKVIELAGKAADGVRGHVGQTVDAPIPALQDFGKRFEARFKFVPDHNGIKGYMAVHAVKWATEKLGKFEPTKVAATLHGATIKPEEEPGILMETTFDAKGDVQRESFLAEVVDGKQKIIGRLPK